MLHVNNQTRAYFTVASLQCVIFPTVCKASMAMHLTLNLLWESIFLSSILPVLFHICHCYFITCLIELTSIIISSLSGSNNWGEIKSNFMGHKSSASRHCSDIPAPTSGGRQKYELPNGVFCCQYHCY